METEDMTLVKPGSPSIDLIRQSFGDYIAIAKTPQICV